MMYGDNGVLVDFEKMGLIIDGAGVFAFGFPHFPERLLVDARSNEREGPLVQVVEPAGSPQQRLTWLYRRRPSLGAPQTLSFLVWPHSVSFLVDSAVWDRIRRRVSADVESEVRAQCDLALKQLQNLDLSASQAVLRGEQCVNLWPPQEVKEGRV
jgi:hypothetical protein